MAHVLTDRDHSPTRESATPEVASIMKTYQWLEKAGLTEGTEALTLAAQKHELSTRSVAAWVYHTRQGPKYRPCIEA